MMNRIAAAFESIHSRGTPGLITYTTVGYPSVEATIKIVAAMISGGADLIELGVPFSDPLADGATVQRATLHALSQGVTVRTCIETVETLRSRGAGVPLVLMGYINPLLSYGLGRFFADAASVGVDGLIAVDATLDEAEELGEAAAGSGIDLIQLVAPTTSDARLRQLLPGASGFIYCVSVAGTTGARGELPASLPALVARVKQMTNLPVAVGFGVSKREHVASIGRLCEAAVIGSALVDVIERSSPDDLVNQVREYVEEVTGRGGVQS
jgi:tryptophan synthase alpha chain